MKKWICVLCLVCLLCSGCAGTAAERDIACGEIVEAYEAAGYTVLHKDPSGMDTYECYIAVEDAQTGEQIYFHRFPTAVEAQSYAETRQYNVLLWLFSVIYGDPGWQQTTTYGVYEIEYEGDSIFDPFAKLIQ